MIEFVQEEYKSNFCARGLQNFMQEECKCYILFRKNINVIFFVRRLIIFLQEKCKCYILCKKNTNVIFIVCARRLQHLCEKNTNGIIHAGISEYFVLEIAKFECEENNVICCSRNLIS